LSLSDQATSSLTSSCVSEHAANCFRQTSELSSVQQVKSHEMKKYRQMASADEGSGCLPAVDNGADYLHIVDDNHCTVNDETSCNRLDGVKSHRESSFQQQGYHPLVEDDCSYEEIAGNNPSYCASCRL
jgi:hypothetical protein